MIQGGERDAERVAAAIAARTRGAAAHGHA